MMPQTEEQGHERIWGSVELPDGDPLKPPDERGGPVNIAFLDIES